jgi:hypothetical protein
MGRIRVRTLNYGSGSKRPKNIGFGSGTLVGKDWLEKMSLLNHLTNISVTKYTNKVAGLRLNKYGKFELGKYRAFTHKAY